MHSGLGTVFPTDGCAAVAAIDVQHAAASAAEYDDVTTAANEKAARTVDTTHG